MLGSFQQVLGNQVIAIAFWLAFLPYQFQVAFCHSILAKQIVWHSGHFIQDCSGAPNLLVGLFCQILQNVASTIQFVCICVVSLDGYGGLFTTPEHDVPG